MSRKKRTVVAKWLVVRDAQVRLPPLTALGKTATAFAQISLLEQRLASLSV